MPAKTRLTRRGRAVELLALGEQTHEQIATRLGVNGRTVRNWLKDTTFVAELGAAKVAIREALRAEGIANKRNRIDALDERWRLLHGVIIARSTANRQRARQVDQDAENDAPEEEMEFDSYAAAGAETGLLVHTVTYLRDGRREEWAVDTGLLKEMREHEKQAAQELGQWTEKRDVVATVMTDMTVKHEHDFDADGFTRLFAEFLGVGAAPADGDPQSLYPAPADAASGAVSDDPEA